MRTITCTVQAETALAYLCTLKHPDKKTGKRKTAWLSKKYIQHIGKTAPHPYTGQQWDIFEIEKWLYKKTFEAQPKKPLKQPRAIVFKGLNTNKM